MTAVGDNFLRYKIISLIGSGGMGEVYLAKDTQLDRKVAVKILKPKLSHRHGDALERFILEARSASALNHPNIITIYEIGENDGSHYIASEFVDGATLHDRINRKSLSLSEVVTIAVQTAAALTAAHAAGIVHRDIKPENVMVRSDGYVKVLDFGLAKLTEVETELADGDADTRRLVATNPGLVMGTVSYMSPEQARGKLVDKRTDIWSLGVVIYEMLTGVRPFTGETTSDVIAAILKSEPEPISNRATGTPYELERIVGKALRKDREERYQNIKDMLIDLTDLKRNLDVQMRSDTASFGYSVGDNGGIPTGNGNTTVQSTAHAGLSTNSISEMFKSQFRLHPILLTLIVAVLAIGAVIAGWGIVRAWPSRSTSGFESMRFSKLTSLGNVEGGQVAVSPDGKYFAYVAREQGGQSLWVRQTSAPSGVQLAAVAPVQYSGITFSRDGAYIYYSAAEPSALPNIFKIPVLGGEKRKLVSNGDGPISFSPNGDRFAFVRDDSSLMIAGEDGNSPSVLANADEGNGWQLPTWSPDGKRIVSGVYTRSDNLIHLFEVGVDSGKKTELQTPTWLRISGLAWLPDGNALLISGRDAETQFSQVWRMYYADGKLTRVTNDVTSYDGLSISNDGNSVVSVQVSRLANLWSATEANPADARQITNATNRDEGLSGVAWAPDGAIIYTTRVGAVQDLWSVNADGTDNRQLTFNARSNFSPAVSPDGRYIVFVSTRAGGPDIWRIDRDGGDPLQLTSDPGIEGQPMVSTDGRSVVYHIQDGNDRSSIWKIDINGGTPTKLTEIDSMRPAISPDGRTIAFRLGPTANGEAPKVGFLDLDGSNERQSSLPAIANARYFRFSSDGKALLYIDSSAGGSRLFSQPLAGGEPKQLAEFKGKRIYSFDVSPKGIIYALGSETSEALMISNFR
jgi:serine/threonine protein kinase/Tol biopolymer transport system component